MMERVEIKKLEQYKGEQIRISGIVENIQDHGGILFLEVSDLSFLANAVITPDKEKAFAMAKNIKKGYLVDILGTVKECPLSSKGLMCEISVETLAITSARTRLENAIKIVREK